MDVIWQIIVGSIVGIVVFFAGYFFKAYRDRPRITFTHRIIKYGLLASSLREGLPDVEEYIRLIYHGKEPITVEYVEYATNGVNIEVPLFTTDLPATLDSRKRTIDLKLDRFLSAPQYDIVRVIAKSDTGKVFKGRPKRHGERKGALARVVKRLKN